jgi:hypothetical protein
MAAALLALAGCGPSFSISTPPGFVELDEEYSAYDYRATNADGVVLAVRELEHEPQGELAFWIKAIENRMRERGGYALLETKPAESADGVSGLLLKFGLDVQAEGAPPAAGKPHIYELAVFVTPEKLFLVEAGGTQELLTAQQGGIDAALRSFRTSK